MKTTATSHKTKTRKKKKKKLTKTEIGNMKNKHVSCVNI